mgnify:CR=1 FL=1
MPESLALIETFVPISSTSLILAKPVRVEKVYTDLPPYTVVALSLEPAKCVSTKWLVHLLL